MIVYDREAWWQTCFSWRGTVLPYILPRVGLLTAFALVLCALDEWVLQPRGWHLPSLDPTGHTILALALSLLIVFRTNSSNNRYWEARSHWGMIVNTCRNLVRMAEVYAPPGEKLAKTVTAYIVLLKEQLRDSRDLAPVRALVSGRELECLAKAANPAQLLTAAMSSWIDERLKSGQLDALMAQRMESLVGILVDSQGGCEKIHRTPLPFAYAALIKLLLFLYLGSLPFVLITKMGFVAPLVLAGVAISLLGIEEAGVEVEDPFGLDANHLALDQICAIIGRDVADLAPAPPPPGP